MLEMIGGEFALQILRAVVVAVLGLVVARLASAGLGRLAGKRASPHQMMLLRRGSFYLILALFLVSALHQLGFNLGVLLGAAGILTVAIGFASQTSASNLISGLFLLAEKPFAIGDTIRVGTTTGEVLSVDLLSVKLRTFDNLYVRIPNESLIKAEMTNLTKFPIRRLDIPLGVAYGSDMQQVHAVLMRTAEANPLSLEEPQPLFVFLGFGESSLDIQFSVWAQSDNFLALRNSILQEIQLAFEREGIDLPFPQRTLGLLGGGALKVQLQNAKESSDA